LYLLIYALLGIVKGTKALLACTEIYSSHGVWIKAAYLRQTIVKLQLALAQWAAKSRRGKCTRALNIIAHIAVSFLPSTNVFVIQSISCTFWSYIVFTTIVSSTTVVHFCVHAQIRILASDISSATPKSA